MNINIIPGSFMELAADADRASPRDIFCPSLNSYVLELFIPKARYQL